MEFSKILNWTQVVGRWFSFSIGCFFRFQLLIFQGCIGSSNSAPLWIWWSSLASWMFISFSIPPVESDSLLGWHPLHWFLFTRFIPSHLVSLRRCGLKQQNIRCLARYVPKRTVYGCICVYTFIQSYYIYTVYHIHIYCISLYTCIMLIHMFATVAQN